MSTRTHPEVVVLGAGIQGACAALALAHDGHRVVVVDSAEDCMLRASLRNEGKIHLGFVYANDLSGRSSRLMLDAAMQFDVLVDRWCGRTLPWPTMRSRPFTYLVLEDSIVPPAVLLDAYATLERRFAEYDDASYLGSRRPRLFERIDTAGLGGMLNRERVAAAVSTAEVALDTARFRAELRQALHAHPLIEVRYSHTVRAARRAAHGFEVSGTRADTSAWALAAPAVVNCLWDHRIAIDLQLDIAPHRAWVHRLKYRLLGHLPDRLADLPSLTLVLGRFGDVVVNPGAPTYLSWYPACLAGWDPEPSPPTEWALACAGDDRGSEARALAGAAVAGLAEIVPGIADFRVESTDAGVITAWGATDIDDPVSDLHERSDIGVHAHDGWFSIDTGKFTTAPFFARQVARAIGG